MANEEHVALLKKGVAAWNQWRSQNPKILPDLSGADFNGAKLIEDVATPGRLTLGAQIARKLIGVELYGINLLDANLQGTLLRGANLRNAFLVGADLSGADLSGATLLSARCTAAKFRNGKLPKANLELSDLSNASLVGADLTGANLTRSTLVKTDLTRAVLVGSRVYGISAWNVKLDKTKQHNLVVTPEDEPEITVDNIEVAQFVYLLLHNKKIRDVIDTIGKKGVLLLGRFTEGRIAVLERLREKLRDLGFVPMVFNFDKPDTKDFTETVRLLANLSHFVIVDITNPRSAPLELQATVPDYMVPFVPIMEKGQDPFSMFVDLQIKYDWVLQPVIVYPSADRLIEVLDDEIVRPAEAKFNQLLMRRTQTLRTKNV
jgi:hypothetical protein